MNLATPERIRSLQRKLYCKAKAVAACLTMKPVGKPDAGNPHVRFDERGRETGRCRTAQATAPFLDSTNQAARRSHAFMRRAYEREGRATSAVDRLAASPVLFFSCKVQVNKRSATAIAAITARAA
jgi:hypothetical protein